ncbi:tetratricopeptide repeat protein [Candidatus Haliotispira prima]|uniref:Tetratricopeptide repeat protein n=1 Tax=Candidatus Haliotispira prima TaxID=3034016 RepID=A0ABY8MEJ9_9SPIO|nr:tetratricopeptide repeat protein [Candidatus Haliotispira prima]
MASEQQENLSGASPSAQDIPDIHRAKVLKQKSRQQSKGKSSVKAKSSVRDRNGGVRRPASPGAPTGKTWGPASLVFVLFILLASLLLVFLVFRESRSFEAMLREIDQIQGRGRGVVTLNLYQSVAKKARSERDYLRILKRIYQISEDKTRNNYLAKVTALAVREFPESESLWAYRVSALLNRGLFTEAISASVNLQSSQYLPLKGEIMIHSLARVRTGNGAGAKSAENRESVADGELRIGDVVNASPYTTATYISLARLLSEPRFAWNATLMYMAKGEKDKALGLVRELQDEYWLNSFAAGLVAYDSEDWSLAAKLLERAVEEEAGAGKPEMRTLQYLGDASLFLKDYERAAEVLSRAGDLVDGSSWLPDGESVANFVTDSDADPGADLEQDGDVLQSDPSTQGFRGLKGVPENPGTWELYYNLASAYRGMGEDATAFEVLRKGRNTFPNVGELLLLLNLVAPPDEKEYAKGILAEFISKETNDRPYLALASLIFEENRVNQQRFSSRLWKLFSKFPEYEQTLSYLLWYYVGLNRTGEVDLALERYRNLVLENPEKALDNVSEDGAVVVDDFPPWAKEYMAINAVLKRDFDTAQEIFGDLTTAGSDWRIYYNMANLYVYQTDFPAAVRMLRKALEYVNGEEDKISIYYRMVMIANTAEQSYLSLDESLELDRILRNYVSNNYRIEEDLWNPGDDLLHTKLDSLVLWRKVSGSDLLDNPDEYRDFAAGQAEFGVVQGVFATPGVSASRSNLGNDLQSDSPEGASGEEVDLVTDGTAVQVLGGADSDTDNATEELTTENTR